MKKFTVKDAISYGLNTYKKNWKFFLVLLLMVWGAYAILSWLINVTGQVVVISFVARILVWVAEIIIGIGLIKVAIDFATKKTPDYKDLYLHYHLFWKYLGGSILYGLIVLGGLILLVIPGIYWAIKYHFVLYLVVDKKMGPIKALKKSGKITQGVKMELFLLGLALIAINIVGMIFFGIGLLVSVPITMLATAYVYEKLL